MNNKKHFVDGIAINPLYYDCVIHLDGTAANILMTDYVVNKLKLKPLAVTFNNHYYEDYQKVNVKKMMEDFDLNHIMFSARKTVIDRVKNKGSEYFNALTMAGQLAFSLTILDKYKIQYLFINQDDSPFAENRQVMNRSVYEQFVARYGVTFQEELGLSNYDMCAYRFPKYELFEGKTKNVANIDELIEKDNEVLNGYVFCNEDVVAPPLYFWIGFDDNFQEVPFDKPYPETRWTRKAEAVDADLPLFDDVLKYCSRCCLPVTAEGLTLDEFGVCEPCRSSEQKMHINWEKRGDILKELFNQYDPGDDGYYDCLLPMSGGKDSTFQAYLLTNVYKKRPLAVTHGHNWFSLVGRYNLLNCIERFDIDHIIFHARRKVINSVAQDSLSLIGDTCWHCHIGAGNFPVQVGIRWGVKLLCYGESIAENDGRATYDDLKPASLKYNVEISARKMAEELVSDKHPEFDMMPWFYPSEAELNNSGLYYLHLGNYMFWDDEKQMDFVRDNFDWREDKVENTYKGYKSVECVMAGVHDYTKFLKRGFGRGTDHASDDVRRGTLTREEGFLLAKKFDTQRPHALDYYMSITGHTEQQIEETLQSKREDDAKKLPRS